MPTSVDNMKSTTIHTYLGTSTDGKAYAKLVSIKDFPDLGGAPDKVEITDLDNDQQQFLLGVQSMENLEFTCNYVPAEYDEVAKLCDNTIRKFCVSFGNAGEYGIFTWEGQISIWVTGGGVNAPREMKISISASTKVTKAKPEDAVTFAIA